LTYVRVLDAVEEGLPLLDPDYSEAIRRLPAGVFVWKWEFEATCGEKTPHAPGEPENSMVRVACYDPLIPTDMREVVMEGFGQYISDYLSELVPVAAQPVSVARVTVWIGYGRRSQCVPCRS
jgi:hypothetical protein